MGLLAAAADQSATPDSRKKAAQDFGDYRGWGIHPEGPRPLCRCGCGAPVATFSGATWARFIKGHQSLKWPGTGKTWRDNMASTRRVREYGLTDDAHEALRKAQDFRCAICREEPQLWAIDHCHRTGKVRGLLCRNCNAALGSLGDDPERLRIAAAYLENPPWKR